MIPRVIHQLWIGPRPAPARWIETWRRAHPAWRHVLWDNDRCAAFGFRNAAEIDRVPQWNGKADIMRYEILLRHGGVFVDADAVCLRPLDDRFLRHDCWACFESERLRPGLIATGYLGAVPGCELIRRCVELVRRRDVTAGEPWQTLGPGLFTAAVAGYPRLHVYPSGLFIPRHHTGLLQPANEPPFADQMWDSTRRERAWVLPALVAATVGAWVLASRRV